MPAVAVPAIGATAIGGETGTTNDPPVVTSVAATTTANTGSNTTVSWAYSQPQGRSQAFYRVQAKDSTGATTHHDSGWLTGPETAYTVALDPAGVPANTTLKWVVSAKDGLGSISSEASANVAYSWGNPQVSMSTVEGVTVPTDGRMTVGQAANVTLAWTFSDGGNTQSAYRVRVLDAGTDIELFSSGWVAGAGTTYDIPFTFTHGMTYELRLQVKNNYGMRSS